MKIDIAYIRPSLLADVIVDLEDDNTNPQLVAKLKRELGLAVESPKDELAKAFAREWPTVKNPYK